ncbi:hypothetical protein J8J17_26395, partial [Mycobacterium tuberculosis]|nr:hypothetical protein [Mycobacterium tuberculosis]
RAAGAFNDAATTETYTPLIVGSVRCVYEAAAVTDRPAMAAVTTGAALAPSHIHISAPTTQLRVAAAGVRGAVRPGRTVQ